MISDNVKISGAKLQSLELKFSFQTQPDKLIVQATSSKFNEEFIGQIPANPYIDFQLIKQMIEEGEFKTLMKTQELLKIRIGATILELVPIQKKQIKDLKEALQKSLKKQTELQKIIQSQKKRIDEHDLLISDLKKTVEDMKLSPKVSINMMEEMKQQFKKIINQLNDCNHKIENKISSIQNNLNENNLKFSSNQKFIEEIWNGASQEQDKVYKMRIQSFQVDVNNLKKELREVNEFTQTNANNLQAIKSQYLMKINDLQNIDLQEMKLKKTMLDGFFNNLNEFDKIRVKISQFDSVLQKQLANFQQTILKHPIIKQLIEEKIEINERQRKQKQQLQKQRQQKQRQQKQRQQKQRQQRLLAQRKKITFQKLFLFNNNKQ